MANSLPSPCDLPEISRANQDLSNNYEYLDHPADIQIHAWGADLSQAYEQVAVGMFAYMTDLAMVEEKGTETVTVEGHDLESLLYNFLDELLFVFSAEPFFVPKRVKITEFNKDTFTITGVGYGETFDLTKHTQGTEVKAITYSNLQVHDTEEKHEVYVIVDI
ncbi:protein archease-like [Halichondria panicea]|uniref:protein archease-like n=1 Tax=Halichondria panicea TaxID=6063 RepID=UPI00312B32BA